MERLRNIDLDNYDFSVQEQPILALIKLYLNTAEEPVGEVEGALESEAGLAGLIEKAKGVVEIRESYSDVIKQMLASFTKTLNGETCAKRYWEMLRPFLNDCHKELAG